MSWVFEHSTAHLGARLVLLAIANHADRDGRNSWASVRQLSEEARCSERQVQYALRELESVGEIVLVGTSPRRTHVYELPLMATLWGGADIAPEGAERSGADSAPRKIRQVRVQNPAPKGEQSAPEPSKNRPKGNRPKTLSLEEHPEAARLCQILSDLIVANGSKKPIVGEAWLTEARRLLTLDKRPFAEAEQVLRWSQADQFWKANVLSMPKFREKYDQLRLASMRSTARRGSVEPEGPGMRTAKLYGLIEEEA